MIFLVITMWKLQNRRLESPSDISFVLLFSIAHFQVTDKMCALTCLILYCLCPCVLIQMEYQVAKPTNVSAPQPLVLHQIPVPFGESSGVVNSSSSANGVPTKPRMRWTPELHEAFVEAVNKLGGGDSA